MAARVPILTFLGCMLAACAVDYQAPTGGPTAQIMFDSALEAGRGAVLYSDAECHDERVVSPFLERKWLTVRADEPLWIKRTFNTLGLAYGRYCESFVTFAPKANESYVVSFNINAGGCNATVSKLGDAGSKEPEPSAREFAHPKCGSRSR